MTSSSDSARWKFGAVAPQGWAEAGGNDPWWLEARTLVVGRPERIGVTVEVAAWDDPEPHRVHVELDLEDACLHPFHAGRLRGRVIVRYAADHLAVRVENLTPWADGDDPDGGSFASTSVAVIVRGGKLVGDAMLAAADLPHERVRTA